MTEPELSASQQADRLGERPADPLVVAPEEVLLRRISNDPKQYKHGKVMQAAFLPRKQGRDKDGISLQRQVFATPLQFKLSCTDDKIKITCGVVDLPVAVFVKLGLTIVPDKDAVTPPDLPGHVVIKQIKSEYWEDNFTEEQRMIVRGYAADLAGSCKAPLIVPGKPI